MAESQYSNSSKLFKVICIGCGSDIFGSKKYTESRVYCNSLCQRKHQIGEHNPNWKGPEGRIKRICRKCGKDGVKKGAFFHQECSPRRIHSKIYTCSGCGEQKTAKRFYKSTQSWCKACKGKRYKGSMNPKWKGGITPENKLIRNSPEYKAWRNSVFKRDDYTCVWCGQHGGKLHADHIKPFAQYPDLRLDANNGRTLCIPCHMKTDSYLGKSAHISKKSKHSKDQGTLFDI